MCRSAETSDDEFGKIGPCQYELESRCSDGRRRVKESDGEWRRVTKGEKERRRARSNFRRVP